MAFLREHCVCGTPRLHWCLWRKFKTGAEMSISTEMHSNDGSSLRCREGVPGPWAGCYPVAESWGAISSQPPTTQVQSSPWGVPHSWIKILKFLSHLWHTVHPSILPFIYFTGIMKKLYITLWVSLRCLQNGNKAVRHGKPGVVPWDVTSKKRWIILIKISTCSSVL